jgi:cysteinyl-tRNA synthetase
VIDGLGALYNLYVLIRHGTDPLVQQNTAHYASICDFFKLWQQQVAVLPVYSKTIKPNPTGQMVASSWTIRRNASSFVGCSYTRHTNDQKKDNEDLDIEAIEALIEERNNAKRERNFARADAIRNDLNRIHGVYLRDRERLWSTDADSFLGYLGSSARMLKKFGPTGHDYQLCDDAGPSISPLSNDEIHNLIAERLHCKLNRKFYRADEIKQELVAKDVAIDDHNKLWRADGVRIDFAGGRSASFAYTYAPDAGPSRATMTDDEVVSLLADRQECRHSRNFHGADCIRIDLLEAGVEIDDENRMWRADGKSFKSESQGRHNEDMEYGYRGGDRGNRLWLNILFCLQLLSWDLIFPSVKPFLVNVLRTGKWWRF